jgi:hypothetical protein
MGHFHYGSGCITATVFALLMLAAILIMQAVDLGRQTTMINTINTIKSDALVFTRNASCDPPAPLNQCSKGYSVHDTDGVERCTAPLSLGEGETCRSVCFYDNATNTTCNAAHMCVSSNRSECLGKCNVDTSNANWAIVQYFSSQCLGKFDIFPFYTKNNTLVSSCDSIQWAIPFSVDGVPTPDCVSIGGCTLYSVILQAEITRPSTEAADILINEPGFACTDILDTTNASSPTAQCLKITELVMSGVQANQYFRSFWDAYPNAADVIPSANFSGKVCVYQYECAGSDVTQYDQGHFLLGGKRRSLLEDKKIGQLKRMQMSQEARDEYHMNAALSRIHKFATPEIMNTLRPRFEVMEKTRLMRLREEEDITVGRKHKRAAHSVCS